jgi:ribosomal protein L17
VCVTIISISGFLFFLRTSGHTDRRIENMQSLDSDRTTTLVLRYMEMNMPSAKDLWTPVKKVVKAHREVEKMKKDGRRTSAASKKSAQAGLAKAKRAMHKLSKLKGLTNALSSPTGGGTRKVQKVYVGD